jgi:hypothetical protein
MIEDRKFSFVANSAVPTTPGDVLRILGYNVGDINKNYRYTEIFGELGYKGDMQIASADSLAMLRMFFELKGWSLEEMMILSEEHYLEQMKDIRMGR